MKTKSKNSTFFFLMRSMFRHFKKSFLQFLAIISIGAIAITLFVGLLANADVFQAQVNEIYQKGNLASLWVTTNRIDTDDFSAIKEIVGDRGRVESRFYLPVTANSRNVYLAISQDYPSISKPSEITSVIDGVTDEFVLVDKDLESKDNSLTKGFTLGGEIAFRIDLASYHLNKKLLENLSYYVKEGGENVFAYDDLEIKSNITGFMSYPENVTKAQYNSSVVLVSDKAFRKALLALLENNYKEEIVDSLYSFIALALNFNPLESDYIVNPNQFLIEAKEGVDLQILEDDIEDYFAEKEDNNLLLVTTKERMPFFITLNNDLIQARQFTFVFPMVFFLVAVLVILTTISQLVVKDRLQIGTLKAIGVSKKSIYLAYLCLTWLLVFIGILIGEIVGPLLIPNILGQKYQLIYSLPKPTYHFPVLEGILVGVIFMLVAGLVTFLVCRREVLLKPSESMRPPITNMRTRDIAYDSNKKTKSAFFSFKMALRNILLSKTKSIMVVLGVMGCTALLVCGFGIENVINYGIDHDMKKFHDEDITLNYSLAKSQEEITADLSQFDFIEHMEVDAENMTEMYVVDGNKINTRLYLISDNCEYVKVDFDKDGIALSEKVAESLNVKVGDEVHFSFRSEQFVGQVKVIYECFVYNGMIISTSFPSFANNDFEFSSVRLRLKDGVSASYAKEKLKAALDGVSDIKQQQDWRATIQDVMSGILVMTNAVKVFAILLGIVVLYNLSLMNFKERTRDIATMKVLGFSSSETLRPLLIESLTLTLIGVGFGLLSGFPFMIAVMMTNIVELVSYMYVIYPLTYVISFLLTYGVALIINLLLSFRIKQVKMVESLKSVE